MIIPKKYGGLEFSAYAHSCVLVKIASRSATASSTVAVPNSLGPAELLNHYGTEEQKNYYLPRLARGEEVPCFALTGPRAGSDAGLDPRHRHRLPRHVRRGARCSGSGSISPSATSRSRRSRRSSASRSACSIRTSCSASKADIGITCALIPRNTPGITIGRRHFPLNIPFQNGPIQGKDVFVPLDCHHRRRRRWRARAGACWWSSSRWAAASRCPPTPPAARRPRSGPPAPTRASAASSTCRSASSKASRR